MSCRSSTSGENVNVPCDDLTCHFVPGIGEISRETKIGNFELSVRGDEQVVRLKVL